jgi:hypothetical protein
MPDSKVIATLIICIAVLASVFVYNQKQYLFGQTTSPTGIVSVENTNNTAPIQSGDWRASLISLSNATNSPIQIIASQDTGTTDTIDNTLTGQLAKNFMSLYIADQKNGVTVDDTEATNIANTSIANINVTSQAKQYTLKDIIVSNDSSQLALKNYGDALVSAITNNVPKLKGGEEILALASDAIQNNDPTELAQLDPVIAGYKKMISATLKIPVPNVAYAYGLAYVNALSSLLYDVQGLRQGLDDPTRGYVALSSYQVDTTKIDTVLKQMNTQFGKK